MANKISSIFSHHRSLVDAVTGAAVDSETELVALHKPASGSLLQKLTGTASPSKPCFLVIDGELFPLQDAITGNALGFYSHVTFCGLLTNPGLLVEFVWPAIELKSSVRIRLTASNLRLILGVQRGDRVADELVITTHSSAASSPGTSQLSRAGFNNASKHGPALGYHGQRLMGSLRALFQTDGPKAIRLRFFDTLANDTGSCFPELLPFILGPDKLPSLSLPDHSQLVPLSTSRTPSELIASKAPFPMTPLESRTTYASLNDTQAQLSESARVVHVEGDLGLQQWAKVQHEVTPFKLENFVILAVMFKPFTPLRGSGGVAIQFRLPERMSACITSNQVGLDFACSGFLAPSMAMLDGYDALFIIPYRVPKLLYEACHEIHEINIRTTIMASFEPRASKFTLASQLATASALRSPDVARWLPIILNQSPTLPYIDLALQRAQDSHGTANRLQIEKVYDMMLSWRRWNTEQLTALKSIRNAAGGIVLITGPAGTGKTLVQQIICAFFYLIGLHVMVLAPANSNVADFVDRLHKNFPSGDVEGLRIFPRSADLDLKDAVQSEAHSPDEGRTSTLPVNDVHLFEFEMVRAEVTAAGEKYSKGRESGLQFKVLKTARVGTLDGTLKKRILNNEGRPISDDEADLWRELRSCIEKCEQGCFDWHDEALVCTYEQSYEACKGQLVAQSRLIVTTTGNVYSSDIQNNWAQDMHGVECKGVVVILDEACKDNEIDTLGPLMCPAFRHKVIGMVMVGDDRQLEPTDTSAKGRVQFNPFPGRITMPFASRLKSEGHPCVELLEQHRMNVRIAEWPFGTFYPPGMRSSASTYRTLREKAPGLRQCLMRTLGKDQNNLTRLYSAAEEDDLLRSHYLQIEGRRIKRNLSTVVREHILAFFNKVFWYFRAYYGKDLHENVTVIVAYKEARFCWQQALKHIMRKHQMSSSELPNVITIDSSQGTEAPITIIDCSVQQYLKDSDIGFIDDDRRINVAMTRAREVRWFLGGSCSANERYLRRTKLPAYVRYRDHTVIKDSLSLVDGEILPRDGADWLEKLETHHIVLEQTCADDRRRLTGS